MSIIIEEGVLFVVLVAAVAALLYFGVLYLTPLGVCLRQAENRKRLEGAAARVCPVHGPHDEEQMVRLPSGETICPDCYKEILHG